jgi:hypothetical protein
MGITALSLRGVLTQTHVDRREGGPRLFTKKGDVFAFLLVSLAGDSLH